MMPRLLPLLTGRRGRRHLTVRPLLSSLATEVAGWQLCIKFRVSALKLWKSFSDSVVPDHNSECSRAALATRAGTLVCRAGTLVCRAGPAGAAMALTPSSS